MTSYPFAISPELSHDEIGALLQCKQAPDEFVAIMVPAANVQAAGGRDQQGNEVTILTITTVVAGDVLVLPSGGVLDAQGRAIASRAAMQAFPPVPPVARLLVRRGALGAQGRAALLPPVQVDLNQEDPC